MRKALLCATAAATMVSAGATAYAQEGWYGTAKVGAIVDGLQDVDFAGGGSSNGALDVTADPEVDAVFGLGIGYGFGGGLRVEGALGYRNVDLTVPDTFLGVRPAGRVGPDGAGSSRVSTAMINVLKDFPIEGSSIAPYLGLGAGGARVDSRAASTYLTGTGAQANGFDDSDTVLAYNALAGFGIKMGDQLTVDIGYTYTAAPDLAFTGIGGNYESDYQDQAVPAGIRWQFAAPPPPAPPPPPPPPPP
ncbi:MAG: outer membrane beta-barrel protein, partial [Hyphomonadaceae bacterium]|nr:outer membrane beta-barrel protein [Hyphomonadaceae bacterium]